MAHATLGRKTLILSMVFSLVLVLTAAGGKLFAEELAPTPTRRPLLQGIHRTWDKMTQQSKQTSPWGMSYGVASPAQGPAPTQSPHTPWYGYGLGVPTYSYGWFGATYRPARASHTSYYGDTYQWGYRRGF